MWMTALYLALASGSSHTLAEDITPRLFMQSAQVFDSVCQQGSFKIDPEVFSKYQLELSEKLAVFQRAWDDVAATLIAPSEEAAGRKFVRKEYSVALSVCGWIPMADPVFLVSAIPFLGPSRKSKGFDMPMNMNAFVSMTHHELLHSLVDNIVNAEFSNSSQLLEKYRLEKFNILVHLHLMAVQKAAYQRIPAPELMQATSQLYAFIGGDYDKAWKIVEAEGSEKFVNELQAFNQSKPAHK